MALLHISQNLNTFDIKTEPSKPITEIGKAEDPTCVLDILRADVRLARVGFIDDKTRFDVENPRGPRLELENRTFPTAQLDLENDLYTCAK